MKHLTEKELFPGKAVRYYPFIDGDGNPDSEPKLGIVASGPYYICGSVCYKLAEVSAVVDIENLFDVWDEDKVSE